MSEEHGLSDFLQVLNSWKNSEGVMAFVRWSSGAGDVAFSCRAYVFDADEEAIHFATDEDKGNVNMTVSLEKSRVVKMEKRSVVLAWDDSGAQLLMSVILQ